MSVLIEASGLCKIYRQGQNEIRALDNVSIQIEQGSFVALMGPSASGKTTLLNIIAGIDRPTSGTILVDGQDIRSLNEARLTAWRTRGVGYVFQFYNLLPILTAFENVELPLLILPLSKKQRREHVAAALQAVGIADFASHLPRQLSGGQEQRVAIARAIVTDPKIIVADEPTGNLDARSETEIMELLRRLHAEFGKTIVMVTHDAAAAAYAGRKMKLEKGRLVDGGGEVRPHAG